MYKLTIAIFIASFLQANVFAQSKSPREVYSERIQAARTEYRVAIAKQIRAAKVVEVFLLKFDDVRKEDVLNDDETRFPIGPYQATTSVISQRKLTAEEMKPLLVELADRIAKPDHTGGAFCHFPIHGVRVFAEEHNGDIANNLPIYSGSFCWECSNFGFEYPDGAEWLDTNDKLQKILSKLMPIPDSETKRFKNGAGKANHATQSR